jgi:hypothetical protein
MCKQAAQCEGIFVGMAALVPRRFLMQAGGDRSVAVIDFDHAVTVKRQVVKRR